MSMLSPGAGQDALGCRLAHDRLERSFAQVVQRPVRQPVMGIDLQVRAPSCERHATLDSRSAIGRSPQR